MYFIYCYINCNYIYFSNKFWYRYRNFLCNEINIMFLVFFLDFINDKIRSFVLINYLNNIVLCLYKLLSKICIYLIKNMVVCNC